MNPDYSMFKYYKGEKSNPFDGTQQNENAAMTFWSYERMFEDSFNKGDFSFAFWEPYFSESDTSEVKELLSTKPVDKQELFKLWLFHLLMEYLPDKHEFSEPNRFLNLYFNSTSMQKPINNTLILGAIIGDIIGSVFEFHNVKTRDFEMFGAGTDFTDDSVLTFATMDSILNGIDYTTAYQTYGRRYPHRGYGGFFRSWIRSYDPQPYNSFGNGSAMRVSPVGWAYDTLEGVLLQAKKSAEVTHNHPEGIKGAQATAVAVFLARNGSSKAEIRHYIQDAFGYDLERHIDDIRPCYHFNETCQETVPEAIIAFLESEDYESAIRLAISIGGDSDTVACITGGIAEAFYKEIPEWMMEKALGLLPGEIIELIAKFSVKYRTEKL